MISKLYTKDCICTKSGIFVNLREPTVDMFCIEDIAHGLSMECRFGGHVPSFYSVAQHSVLCTKLATTPQTKLEALLHDASEAYLKDIPKPLKNLLPQYEAIEDRFMRTIAQKFGFQYPLSEEVKRIDQKLLELEWECFKGEPTTHEFKCWTPEYAKETFLDNFKAIQPCQLNQ